ncbi:hypothetical protein [Leisingera sp. F5]|uniref:hypothetical protein n=1 Tax=Leisingera sp. F5 TaxID=1813816 RepID=UPI000A5CDF50|nr:hypothetical protein [Leisingera sp. F5]
MTLSLQLDALRQTAEGSRLAAFGDLGTSMVLRSSSAASQPQEYLDGLCQQARLGFLLLDAAVAAGDTQAAVPTDDILVLTPGEARIFVRAADGSGDAVLCVCSDAASAGRLAVPARGLLAAMAGEA